MGKALLDFGLQVGQSVIGAGMGMLLGKYNDARQLEQERKLQAMQIAGSKELTDYQQMKQLEMWKATNYGPQMEQLKKAGLNPGLIYGMGGGGGATTGSTAGNVGRSNAPTGGGEAIAMAQTAAQLGLLKAQKENIEADTTLKHADATKTAGIDTKEAETRIKSLTEGINETRARTTLADIQRELGEIEVNIQKRSSEDQIRALSYNSDILNSQMEQMRYKTNIDEETWRTKVGIIKEELLLMGLQGQLLKASTDKTRSDIQVNQAQIRSIITKIVQDWKSLELQGNSIDDRNRNMKHQEWANDLQETTKLPIDVIEKVLQAVFLREIMKQPSRTTVTGYR